MEKVQLVYDAKAKESGVYILEACGFDSVPVEMGLLFMKQQFSGRWQQLFFYDVLKWF